MMTAPPGYDPSSFPPFAVTADIAVFTVRGGRLLVALVERAHDPFRGAWALPGGFVDEDEDLDAAATRELSEETGLELAATDISQLGVYGAPDRDPRMRVVSVVYWALVPGLPDPIGASDAADARLLEVTETLASPDMLAFDHHRILGDARRHVEAAPGVGRALRRSRADR